MIPYVPPLRMDKILFFYFFWIALFMYNPCLESCHNKIFKKKHGKTNFPDIREHLGVSYVEFIRTDSYIYIYSFTNR